jgi:hypothetical protein
MDSWQKDSTQYPQPRVHSNAHHCIFADVGDQWEDLDRLEALDCRCQQTCLLFSIHVCSCEVEVSSLRGIDVTLR